MPLTVYLSGEIHTDWREQVADGASDLDVAFTAPVTDHSASDDCGATILGKESQARSRVRCPFHVFHRLATTNVRSP